MSSLLAHKFLSVVFTDQTQMEGESKRVCSCVYKGGPLGVLSRVEKGKGRSGDSEIWRISSTENILEYSRSEGDLEIKFRDLLPCRLQLK